MAGWGSAIGKLFDWLPGRRESMQNKIDAIKKEMYGIQQKRPFDSARYERLADQLRDLEAKEKRTN